jgi:acyl-CoA thioester hydrolase
MEIKPYIHNAKYYETDQMSIVHHSNYIRWFEEARVDWMNQIGVDLRELEAHGIVIPVIGVSAQYKTMTHFGDDVAITSKVTRYNGVRFMFSYEVRDAHTGELRATGESDHCFLDENNKVINLRKREPKLHQYILAQLEK